MDNHLTKNEKEGLIPVNINLLKSAIKNEDKLEYLGITLSEITFVGFIVKYTEFDTRTVLGIWDQTGYQEVLFYNKSENESHSGLVGFTYNGSKMPVRVFGKVKYFKNELRIDGAKILKTDMNELIYHKLVLISDWIYLTSKEKLKEEGSHYNIKNGANNKNQIEIGGNNKNKLLEAIEYFNNTKGICLKEDLISKLGMKDKELEDQLNVLIRESLIFNDGGNLQII